MILDELFTSITHVATQLTGRWYPIPRIAGSTLSQHDFHAVDDYLKGGISAVTEHSWYELLENDASNFESTLPWLEALLRTRNISLKKLAEAAARNFAMAKAANAVTVSIHSPIYPPLLRWISRPPLLLTALGNSEILNSKCIGIIGSRKATYEALRMSVETGTALAHADWTIVSGGAIGCDIAVHEGMLASRPEDVRAVVVLACGLHERFPKCNERAFAEIVRCGGVCLSERLWFQGALPRDFPARNRIVSGMSHAVVVMAAASRSGSLITAQEALEQGRDVYVYEVESNSEDVRFEGSRQLIDDGAFAFHNTEHLLGFLSDGYDSFSELTLGHTRGACQLPKDIGIFRTESANF